MKIEDLAPEALKLPVADRAELASALWSSIEDPNCPPGSISDEEAIDLATKRDAEIEAGTVTPLSHDDVMSRLRG